MTVPFVQFADAAQGGALGALGLNVNSFLFQLITFVLMLLILRKYAFPPLMRTLEERRMAVEKSIDQAKQTELAMAGAEKKIEHMLAEARDQATELVAAGHKQSADMIEAAETKATQRAEHIVSEARVQMNHELNTARQALKRETAKLVAEAAGNIIREKVDTKKDAGLITAALAEAGKENA